MQDILHYQIKDMLDGQLNSIEQHFDADVISYTGDIRESYIKVYRDFIEELATQKTHNKLAIILKSPGGSAEVAEKIVDINRNFYEEVYFIVPDYAMSAGTILCMSGDKIYMDYSSSLGPIDPQVLNREKTGFIPALGYLDKVEELIRKSDDGTLTDAEYMMLKGQDLGMLSFYEQARELSISLLKSWLVKYKFKNWSTHRVHTPGKKVTQHQKEKRAEEIAKQLGDNNLWHSHGRFINISTLTETIRLEIDDMAKDEQLHLLIRKYNDTLSGVIDNKSLHLHSRLHFS